MKLYTDGSANIKTLEGGWGCLVVYDDGTELQLSGCEKNTTNNRMEIMGVIFGIKEVCYFTKNIEVYSDSKYVINCAQKIFKRSKNLDLWEIYDNLTQNLTVTFTWVKAHNGHRENEIADFLSRNYIF